MAAGSTNRGAPPSRAGLSIPAYFNGGQNALDASGAQEKWRTIEHAITQIYRQNASTLSFQALYTAGYHIVLHKHGEILYTGVEKAVKKHVAENRAQVLAVDDANFLEALLEQWQKHRTAVQMIRDILMYMDKNYVPATKRLTVYELGVKVFGEHMLKQRNVAERVQALTMGIIAKERSGERPPGPFLLKGVTTMMCEVGRKDVYEPCLEQNFLAASEEFYKKEAAAVFHTITTPEYIQRVFHRLSEEHDRVERCLAEQTASRIERVIKERMIRDYADAMLEKEGSGVMVMLNDWRIQDLRLLYNAFSLISHTSPFVDRLHGFLLDKGARFVQDPEQNENPCSLVEGVMQLRTQYDELLFNATYLETGEHGERRPDPEFEKAIRLAFAEIVNKNARFAEYMSLFVDAKLRKKGGDEDLDILFDRVLVLFRYLRDKDMFEKYYKNHLARRLLFGKTVEGGEGERLFIAKLKQESGHQFTTKIEGMFKDMAVSADTMDSFRQKMAERGQTLACDLQVQVLTTGFWPLSRSTVEGARLPAEVDRVRRDFQNYYLQSHNGRRLTWQLNMGSADMRFVLDQRKFELNVHTLQMVILMLFNRRESWTLREVAAESDIPLADLRKQVMSLTMSTKTHTRILNRDCQLPKDIGEATELSVNTDFKSKHVKIKIAAVPAKETDDEAKETRTRVDDDRKWQIDAVIVRIMKSRKTMEHRNLIADCITHLQDRFAPTPDDIKRRIESLIEREYLERSKESRATYVYLA